jgi:D-alanine-D-alanine ligase-like ATP-grasp enzyme
MTELKEKNICKHCGIHAEPIRKKKKNYCPDCGGAQVNHLITYLTILLGALVEPWTNWMSKIIPEDSLEWIGPSLTKTLTFLHLGKITKKPESDDSYRTRVLWDEAIARNIDMYEFRLFGIGHDIFVSKYKGEMRFFDVLPRPKNYNPKGLEWMDNKNQMKKHFIKAGGIPVAKGGVACTKNGALKIFNSLDKPAIVKPNIGSRSRHTTTHISSQEEFLLAFKKAKQLSPWIMIEEELTGYVFRGTIIDKKLVAVIRREPAYVIGDGVHNIRDLVDIENKNIKRQGPIFHQLVLDKEALKELAHFNRTIDTIPKKDEIITLGQKTSRAVGGGITDMTEVVHKDNKEMLERVAEVLDDPLIGVDFIMEDVSKSWKEQPRSGVIECNSAPFIDLHHFPLIGEPRNVASKLWDIIYPLSRPQ